jgi:cephalosporin hydroxylase
MQQTWEDLVLWEWFLNRVQVRSILELGTGSAAFSCYLLTQCISRGLSFATIDVYEPEQHSLHRVFARRMNFYQIDLSKPSAKQEVEQIIAGLPRPIVLYCDNGDKPHEVATFGPLLDRGDYLGVHDFGIEFHDHDLTPVRDRVVELVTPDEALGRTRWYEVVR